MLYCPQHCEIRFVQHYVQWGMVKDTFVEYVGLLTHPIVHMVYGYSKYTAVKGQVFFVSLFRTRTEKH